MLRLISISFLVGLAAIAEPAATGNVCKTESCLESSNTIKQSMDPTVDPCDNFYKYACGNFPRWKEEKHHYKDKYTWFDETQHNTSEKIRDFLNSDLKKSAPQAVKKAQLLFHSCADTDAMDKKGLDPLRDLFQGIGVTPDPPFQVYTQNFSWTYSAAKMKRLLNLNFLIQVDVHTDYSDENSTINRIYLKKPEKNNELKLPRTFNNTMKGFESMNPFPQGADSLPEEFFAFTRALVNVMNSHKNLTELEKKMIDIGLAELGTFQMTRKITSSTLFSPGMNLANSKVMTLQELQDLTDTAKRKESENQCSTGKKYFKTLFDGIEGVNIDLTKEKFFVPDPNYFKTHSKIVAEQSPHLMERAIWFDALSQVAELTTNEMRNIYHGKDGGPFNTTEWVDRCYEEVNEIVGLAILHHFVYDEAVIVTKVKVSLPALFRVQQSDDECWAGFELRDTIRK